MKCQWIRRDDSPRLIVFFNGWGMDATALQLLGLSDNDIDEKQVHNGKNVAQRDLLHCYDYRDLVCDMSFSEVASHYTTVDLVAWSMGVWAAEHLLREHKDLFNAKVAVNGTVPAIHDELGIPRALFQATHDNLTSEDHRHRFLRRTCPDRDALKLMQQNIDRPLDEIREELAVLLETVPQSLPKQTSGDSFYDMAIVGDRDRIFAPANQIAYWLGKVNIHVVHGMPHLPIIFANSLLRLIGIHA